MKNKKIIAGLQKCICWRAMLSSAAAGRRKTDGPMANTSNTGCWCVRTERQRTAHMYIHVGAHFS